MTEQNEEIRHESKIFAGVSISGILNWTAVSSIGLNYTTFLLITIQLRNRSC